MFERMRRGGNEPGKGTVMRMRLKRGTRKKRKSSKGRSQEQIARVIEKRPK